MLFPESRPSRLHEPTAYRISLRVGCPTAAVMRRTWRFRPSRIVSSIQESGIDLRWRMGGFRGHTNGQADQQGLHMGREHMEAA